MCHFNCQTERTVLELKQKLFPSLPQMHEFLDSRREMKEHTDSKNDSYKQVWWKGTSERRRHGDGG